MRSHVWIIWREIICNKILSILAAIGRDPTSLTDCFLSSGLKDPIVNTHQTATRYRPSQPSMLFFFTSLIGRDTLASSRSSSVSDLIVSPTSSMKVLIIVSLPLRYSWSFCWRSARSSLRYPWRGTFFAKCSAFSFHHRESKLIPLLHGREIWQSSWLQGDYKTWLPWLVTSLFWPASVPFCDETNLIRSFTFSLLYLSEQDYNEYKCEPCRNHEGVEPLPFLWSLVKSWLCNLSSLLPPFSDGFDKISSAISYPSSRTPIQELHKRYISRNVHHLQGLKDKGVGDDRPQALAQGKFGIQFLTDDLLLKAPRMFRMFALVNWSLIFHATSPIIDSHLAFFTHRCQSSRKRGELGQISHKTQRRLASSSYYRLCSRSWTWWRSHVSIGSWNGNWGVSVQFQSTIVDTDSKSRF